ncbi:hypothetical protein [Rhizobium lentis]|uniref:Uncharacterized protein n=1 Tax=Rhizobium lentis TaxID=1138194 RepID=A0ABS7I7R8_9HYPH|nr:hypothetical protein [Rhizobium lentis]MBX5039421.1 hypothetical protein [Rhizobium lentis]MBX5071842.1 hypothetical protein [Rhizobium lentis]MBX5087868.1 hypothetical protein [Rhizobium lentis]MBX5101796.1 hypothetical protein [Rhizobium lentis]MBX5108120.1 hypothetical protein [Rhizobium lentis]
MRVRGKSDERTGLEGARRSRPEGNAGRCHSEAAHQGRNEIASAGHQEEIVRAAFYALIAHAGNEPEKAGILQDFAITERTKDDE